MHICIVIYMYSYVLTRIHTRKPNFFAPLKLRITVVIKPLGFRKNFGWKSCASLGSEQTLSIKFYPISDSLITRASKHPKNHVIGV